MNSNSRPNELKKRLNRKESAEKLINELIPLKELKSLILGGADSSVQIERGQENHFFFFECENLESSGPETRLCNLSQTHYILLGFFKGTRHPSEQSSAAEGSEVV